MKTTLNLAAGRCDVHINETRSSICLRRVKFGRVCFTACAFNPSIDSAQLIWQFLGHDPVKVKNFDFVISIVDKGFAEWDCRVAHEEAFGTKGCQLSLLEKVFRGR